MTAICQSAVSRMKAYFTCNTVAEAAATVLQVKYAFILETALWQIAVIAYLAAIALDEIDFRTLLGGIAERRFQRIAMSLGDGLICTDASGRITVWNPGARELFGYGNEEMFGTPVAKVLGTGSAPLSIAALPFGPAAEPTGKLMELEGRRKDGGLFPVEATFSRWEGTDGYQ